MRCIPAFHMVLCRSHYNDNNNDDCLLFSSLLALLCFARSFTMLNLAPMGMGRASFRLAEIIQLGRIPVYLYEDFPWCPYAGTGACHVTA